MLNVKLKILLLNLFTLLPVIFLLAYLNFNHFAEIKKTKIENLKNIANLVASENNQVVESARHLLTTLSTLPQIQNVAPSCSYTLKNIMAKYMRYGNLGVVNNRGVVTCSAVNEGLGINLSDRLFFKETIKNNAFSTGEFVVSRSTGNPSINFGYPLKNAQVIYATLNLDWLSNLIANIDIDKNLVVLVIDKEGVVLARYPEPEVWTGEKFKLESNITDNKIIETTGIDGVKRIYAVKKLEESGDTFVMVGQTTKDIYKTPVDNLVKQIIITILMLITAVYLGQMIGKSLIIKTIDKLKEIDNLRKDFISLISHQIRTPATSIKWFSEILLSDKKIKLNAKHKNIVKDVYVSVKRMIELIGNILQITKLEDGKIKLNKKQLDTSLLLKEAVKEISKEFKNKHIKHKIISNDNYVVNADEKLLYQALYNLIHNAFKYTPKLGRVEVNLSKNKNNLIIKVSDTGIGIPNSEKQNLFSKFGRASNAKMVDTEGAGLGLYLSKLIIEAHAGNIKIKSKKIGTLIFVSIPLT